MGTQPQTAFVLSGGAALGAIQVGMLRALYDREIEPDLIVGTSVGAVNGAFIASRPFTSATTDELAEIWRGLGRGQVFPLNPLTGFLGFFGARTHLVPERGLRQLLIEHIEFERLEQTTVPFHVITTDVLTGGEVRLSRGPAIDAVLASAAIPGIFPPVDWGHRHLMDGGIANHAPISDALELGAERIYVLVHRHRIGPGRAAARRAGNAPSLDELAADAPAPGRGRAARRPRRVDRLATTLSARRFADRLQPKRRADPTRAGGEQQVSGRPGVRRDRGFRLRARPCGLGARPLRAGIAR